MRSACCLKIPLVALPFETITVNGIFLAPRAGFEEAIEARCTAKNSGWEPTDMCIEVENNHRPKPICLIYDQEC